MDGAIRISTIAELARAKGLQLTAHNTDAEIAEAIRIEQPNDLPFFLSKLNMYKKVLLADLNAIERVAYELAEDEAKQGVCYFEVRFCAQFWTNTNKHAFNETPVDANSDSAVDTREVIEAVIRGLRRGEVDFNVKSRIILVTSKGKPRVQLDPCSLI